MTEPMTRCLLFAVIWGFCQDRSAAQDSTPLLPTDSLPSSWNYRQAPLGVVSSKIDELTQDLDEAHVRLGRRLFFDPILSDDGTMSCASCHRPDHGFASTQPLAIGIRGKTGKRNAPSIINRGLGRHQFWDGRAGTLEEQALQPIESADELGSSVAAVLMRLTADPTYRRQFDEAFNADTSGKETTSITAHNLALSIASFEKTLIAANSPVDQFRASQYESLTPQQRTGLWIFESRGKCWQCHSGDNFSDEQFHNTGVGFGKPDRDPGRRAVTGHPEDEFAMKTPTLRGIAQTAPFMHDGSIETLREVVEYYNQGGAANDPQLDRRIQPLKLTPDEVDALTAFLKALTPTNVFGR